MKSYRKDDQESDELSCPIEGDVKDFENLDKKLDSNSNDNQRETRLDNENDENFSCYHSLFGKRNEEINHRQFYRETVTKHFAFPIIKEDERFYISLPKNTTLILPKEAGKVIYNFLKDKCFSLNNINSILGFDFSTSIYRDLYITESNLQKLEVFLGSQFGSDFSLDDLFPNGVIPILETHKLDSNLRIPINGLFVESFSIIFGDGHINSRYINVVLNRVDEPFYVNYVYTLFTKVYFPVPILIYGEPYFCSSCSLIHNNKDENYLLHLHLANINDSDSKAIVFRINCMSLISELNKLGFPLGDKTVNQISVPNFIFENKTFIVKFIRGLFDTDGSIGVHKSKRHNLAHLRISYKSTSLKLVQGFVKICSLIGVKVSCIGKSMVKNTDHFVYYVSCASKSNVKKFLDIVKPQKFNEPFRKLYLALRIIYFSQSRDIRETINKIIFKSVPAKWERRYSKSFLFVLKDTILSVFRDFKIKKIFNLDFDGQFTSELLNHIFDNVLSYKVEQYSLETVKKFKFLFEKLGSFPRVKQYLFDIEGRKVHITNMKRQLERYFNENEMSLNYSEWVSYYSSVIDFCKDTPTLFRISKNLRNYFLELIFNLLYNKVKISFNDIFHELEDFFKSDNCVLMTWLLSNNFYYSAIYDYVYSLYLIIDHIVTSITNNSKIDLAFLCLNQNIQIHFKESSLRDVIDWLSSRFSFDYEYV